MCEKTTTKKAIILNKVFIGDWMDKKGHISHGIIDFLLTDKGERYIYNVPHGTCPEWVYVGSRNKGNTETHQAKYLLITGNSEIINSDSKFYAYYLVELEEKIHDCSRVSRDRKTRNEEREKIIEICENRDIKYCGRAINEIYGKGDESLLVTFKAKSMWKAKTPISVHLNYRYQRNKGYVKSDVNAKDFSVLETIINDKSNWEKMY